MSNGASKKTKKIGTEPYKGVRDFYPEDMFIENYIFDIMRDTVESFGYSEYSASILEPTSLYEAKTGQEIIEEQTYSFTDRGNRKVTLRPEMTPTLARMIAAKKRQLAFPLRWYSISDVFRYERPQRGRLREHFQLNADLFGVPGIEAEVEIITLAYQIMKNFGADGSHFEIRLNFAGLLDSLLSTEFNLDKKATRSLVRIIDKMGKISEEDFDTTVSQIIGERGGAKLAQLNNGEIREKLKKTSGFALCQDVAKKLNDIGIVDTTINLEPFLTRGFEYYTGVIFEIFDTSKYNSRSLFGGGRYDNLLEIFGAENIPAIGFGMGDVTLKDFLETHDLLPQYESTTDLYICTLDIEKVPFAEQLAQKLRGQGVNVAVGITKKKVGDQIKLADKQGVPFILCIGDKEIKKKEFIVKNLKTSEESRLKEDEIAAFVLGVE